MSLDLQKILCPVDLSGFSLEAVKLTAKVTENSNPTLYLLHLIDNPYDELYMESITQADPVLLELYKNEPHKRAQVLDATKTHSEVLLKQFCQDVVSRVYRVRHQVETGDPFEVIIDFAESNGGDLIVLATHGRTGIRRLLIGNVAEKVVRHAPCPVLTVKPGVQGAVAKRGEPSD